LLNPWEGMMELETHDEGIEKLKQIVSAGQEFGCAVIQRYLKWGYCRSFRLMEHAVATGQAVWGETAYRIRFNSQAEAARPVSEAEARAKIEEFLTGKDWDGDYNLEFREASDPEESVWAFWTVDDDGDSSEYTNYLHVDGSIENYGL